MPAIHINNADFDSRVIQADKPVLVDFYADWCGPCKMAEPVLNKLADEYKGKVEIVKLNVDDNQEIAQKYGVMSIPTVVLFKEGKELERKIGYGGEQGYRDIIEKAS